jgi:hypothetical protein
VRCISIHDSATEVTISLRSSEDRRDAVSPCAGGGAAELSAITIILTLA